MPKSERRGLQAEQLLPDRQKPSSRRFAAIAKSARMLLPPWPFGSEDPNQLPMKDRLRKGARVARRKQESRLPIARVSPGPPTAEEATARPWIIPSRTPYRTSWNNQKSAAPDDANFWHAKPSDSSGCSACHAVVTPAPAVHALRTPSSAETPDAAQVPSKSMPLRS